MERSKAQWRLLHKLLLHYFSSCEFWDRNSRAGPADLWGWRNENINVCLCEVLTFCCFLGLQVLKKDDNVPWSGTLAIVHSYVTHKTGRDWYGFWEGILCSWWSIPFESFMALILKQCCNVTIFQSTIKSCGWEQQVAFSCLLCLCSFSVYSEESELNLWGISLSEISLRLSWKWWLPGKSKWDFEAQLSTKLGGRKARSG